MLRQVDGDDVILFLEVGNHVEEFEVAATEAMEEDDCWGSGIGVTGDEEEFGLKFFRRHLAR